MVTAIAALGCAGPQPRADVAVVDLRIEKVSLLQTSLVVTVRIDNEEPTPLVLDGSAHEIYIDGHRVGKGLLSDRIEIPRLGSTRVEVPVQISTPSLVQPIRNAIENRRFDYDVRSTLYVLSGTRTRAQNLSKRGTVDLRALQ